MIVGSDRELAVLINGDRAGTVTQHPDGQLTLTYDDSWRATQDVTPLSLSMPAAASSHPDRVVRAFLWGLLPDNEHELGLTAVRTEIREFESERAIVVERYDREATDSGGVRRIHQEDLCQALAVPPMQKYQNEGGPTPEQIISLLRTEIQPASAAAADVNRFVDALAFSWLTGGTDAHAKNYSALLRGRRNRLAPLYDLASALPYDDMYLPKLKLAMKIGGEYRLEAISGRHWRRFATANRLDPDSVVHRVGELAADTPDALARVVVSEPVRAVGSALPARLLDRISERCRRCLRALGK